MGRRGIIVRRSLLLIFAARACAWGSDWGVAARCVILQGYVGGDEGFEGVGQFLDLGGVDFIGVDGVGDLLAR